MVDFYSRIENSIGNDPNVIISKFGKETEFEAILRLERDEDSMEWDGYFVFKDKRYSPDDGLIQFRYQVPVSMSGAYANSMAFHTWEGLCKIFVALRSSSSAKTG